MIIYHDNLDLAAKKDQHFENPSFRTMMYFSIFLGDPFFFTVSANNFLYLRFGIISVRAC